MEIHGNRDVRWGYWPPGIEGEVQGLGPVGWLDTWKERQECGGKIGEPRAAEFSNATYISRLEKGWLSEGVEFGGGAVRVAYRCVAGSGVVEGGRGTEGTDGDMREFSGLTLLHYSLRDVGYGWPRLDLKGEERINVNGHEAFPPGDVHFDATKLVLEWFETHPLPDQESMERQAKGSATERSRLVKGVEEEDGKAMKKDEQATKEGGEAKVVIKDEGEKARKNAEGRSERWKDEL